MAEKSAKDAQCIDELKKQLEEAKGKSDTTKPAEPQENAANPISAEDTLKKKIEVI